MCGDVLDGEGAGNDLVGLLVGDLQLELLLQSHHNLHIVQAIQPQIRLEMHVRCHLAGKQLEARMKEI